jgi:hypothetical protein
MAAFRKHMTKHKYARKETKKTETKHTNTGQQQNVDPRAINNRNGKP